MATEHGSRNGEADVSPRTPEQVAEAIVKAVEGDNGVCFCDTWTAPQRERLIGGIARMMVAGCIFTDAEIEQFAAGEHGETLAMFQHFDGFEQAQTATNDIFEELGEHTPLPSGPVPAGSAQSESAPAASRNGEGFRVPAERITELWRKAMADVAGGFMDKSFIPGERVRAGDTVPQQFAKLLMDEISSRSERRDTTPEGWVAVPRELTAENGMKAALSGEFFVRPSGQDFEFMVPWHTLKEIHRAMVKEAERLREGVKS